MTEKEQKVILESEMSIPDVEHTSFSRLNEFLRCSWKYMLKYELGIKGVPNIDMVRGKAGHTALELNARQKIKTGEDMSTQEVLDNFSTHFDIEVEDVDKAERGEAGTTKDQTAEVLRYYMEKEAPLVKPLAVELEFLAPLPAAEGDEPVPPILGYIDTINERSGDYRLIRGRKRLFTYRTPRSELIDRKFPSRKPSNAEMKAELSDQLTMYDMVLTAAGTQTQDIGFENYIPPTKTIPSRIERVYRPPALMTPDRRATRHARLAFKLRQVYAMIRNGHYVPVDDPRVCAGCEVREMCQYSLVKDDYNRGTFSSKSFRKEKR